MLRLLVTYLRPHRLRTFLLVLSLLSGIALALINPQIIRRFIDSAAAGSETRALVQAAGLFLLLALGQQVARTSTSYLSQDLGWRTTNRLRADLTAHCLQLDMAFHHEHTPGALIERVDGDVGLLADYFSRLVIELIGHLLLVLGIIVLLFREWWTFGLVAVAYLLLFASFFWWVRHFNVRLREDDRQVQADLTGFLEETLVGKEDVRALAAEPYVFNRLYRAMQQRLQLGYREAKIIGVTFNTGSFLFVLSTAAVLLLGATRYRQGTMSIGTLFLAAYYVGLLERPMNQIRRQVTGLFQAMAAFGRIRQFLDHQPAILDPAGHEIGANILDTPIGLRFENVSFGYGDEAATVQDIDFRLAPGEILGLLGRTGSGKSTLVRLLFRLYDPSAGAIRLNGRDLRQLPLTLLRQQVGMVSQEVQLFAASVRDNLTFFDATIGDDNVLDALHELGMGAWIEALPQGLDTPIGSGGQGLSAGEAQLLAFARVFLRDPGLVVLDEASSRLDTVTEQMLEQAISRLLAGRSAVIIAHRLDTVRRADQILILDQGRIQEFGRRQALAADPQSQFSKLLQAGHSPILDTG